MTLSFPSVEFDQVVAGVCHGLATEVEMRALNDLLRSDRRALDEYLIRIEIHARLSSEPDLFLRQQEASLGPTFPETDWRGSHRLFPQKPAPRSGRTTWRALALAACLVLILAGVWVVRLKHTANGTTSRAVAMLARVVDAQWGEGTESLRVGSPLEPGRLQLKSGLAQIVFYSGARVVIEGPTELQLISPSAAACPAGRLLAEVPEPARGFRLKTGELDVVDLGTAFGIDATNGRSELHVFKGKVEFSAGTGSKLPLAEGKAALVRGSAQPQFMAASAEAFAAMFDLQNRSLTAEASRLDQWRIMNAQLNRDPSLVVHLDFEDLNGADWALHNAAQKNQSVPDATIVGCQRAEGRWSEKQALEFQSVSDRVRVEVPGEFESVTLSTWVRVQGLDRQFNSLFMCDGFEVGTIHWLILQNGRLSLTVKGPGSGNSHIILSPPVLPLDKFGMWTHLAVVIDGEHRQVVHFVNGTPVSHEALRLGPPYRIGSAELGNWNNESGPNPTPSLIRNLSGSMDEFELFSRALSDSEILALYTDGKPESPM